MDRVSVVLEHCYGIKSLKHDFDFTNAAAFAIYAPNGAMKSSLALTFKDLSNGQQPTDRIFPDRSTVANITDENGVDLEDDSVFVVLSYDEDFGPSEKTCTLLVEQDLRSEFEGLQAAVEGAEQSLLKSVQRQSQSRQTTVDMKAEISMAIMKAPNELRRALIRIKDEIQEQPNAPFADVDYKKIFADDIINALNTRNLKDLILEYITRYNDLLAASTFFKRGVFDYYNAAQIADSLNKNGFFTANHSVNLKHSNITREINTQAELTKIIEAEKEAILQDSALIETFDAVQAQLSRNAALRDFRSYLMENMYILPHLSNLDMFKEDVLKSYIKLHEKDYLRLLDTYESVREREAEIYAEAADQRTQWEEVIDIFNRRFSVPFKLDVVNRIDVMLGSDEIMELGFTYHDGAESTGIARDELLRYLSNGERKAFYVLNVIFEVERRRKDNQSTLLIIDDLADSFDYQNKYAIVQYLRDISTRGPFKQIILTHNFDFLRTIESRFVNYANCLMALKSDAEIELVRAAGVRNVFVNDWKRHFFEDDKKKIASIAFIRNLVEFSRGDTDPIYARLTSMLHWKSDTEAITVEDLDDIYNSVCATTGKSQEPSRRIVDVIESAASDCLQSQPGLSLENKVVLAIATRLAAERFIAEKLQNPGFLASIERNQTQRLVAKFNDVFPSESKTSAVLDRVMLMTPENIHLNSFMYEPIIDMGEEHLRRLYSEVRLLR